MKMYSGLFISVLFIGTAYCMENTTGNSFAKQVDLVLREADLNQLCQMVSCLNVSTNKEDANQLRAESVVKQLHTLNLQNCGLGYELECEEAGINDYLKNRIMLALLQSSKINFFESLSKRAPLFAVEKLILDGNELDTLPSDLNTLPHLHEISVRSNKLCSFPVVLYSIGSLHSVDVSENQITEIDTNRVHEMHNLLTLKIAQNQLSPQKQADLRAAWAKSGKHDHSLTIE